VEDGRISASRRWCDIADAWRAAPLVKASDDEARQSVRTALQRSVQAHLVSDVPVAILLSGGIDSGALAGLMSEAGTSELHGITIAFDEFAGRREDEVPVARRVAETYGIHHHVRRVGRDEFISDLPRIVSAMDQPSIDGINTWYASKAAAEIGLKVMVSGVGGDELFQGYSSFRRLPRIVSWWRPLSRLPLTLDIARWAASMQARRTGVERWRHAADWSRSLASAWFLDRGVFSPEELRDLMDDTANEVIRSFDPESWIRDASGALADDPRLALGQIESTTYLRNQLLRDSDWASMDHSVELRTPLVDWHLLEELRPILRAFAHFPNKSLLAGAPRKPLPREVTQRRKTGFGIPVARWVEPGAVLDSRAWSRRLVAAYSGATPC
jgi:asparagine synthase (glutamine-hydrolysing)